MHLGSLTISRFRSCDNVTVSLRPDLTVLVGENNGGKSVVTGNQSLCGSVAAISSNTPHPVSTGSDGAESARPPDPSATPRLATR